MKMDNVDSASVRQAELLEDAKRGSESALSELLAANREYLLLIADAELESELKVKASRSDLVQDSLLEAQQSFTQFHGKSHDQWRQWLQAIVRNNIRDLRKRYVESAKRNIHREVPGNDVDQTMAEAESAESRVDRQEKIRELAAFMESLPAHYQLVLRMRYWDNKTYEAIAAETDRTAEAVRKLLYRAVEALIDVYQRRQP